MKCTQIAVIVASALLLACTTTVASKTQTTAEVVKTEPATTTPTTTPVQSQARATAAVPVQAAVTKGSFESYVAALKQEAIEKGYAKALVDEVFASLKHYQSAVVADKKQPEFTETLDTYLPKRISKQRIELARKYYKEHQKELDAIGKKYGVQPRFIVALWGLESSFGKIMGSYSVPSALATLAYDGRRETFFKSEFFLALDILQQGHVKLADMKGSWAGAMGQSQFMPSAFMSYAQDGDGDGLINIWQSRTDAFASIANYLKTRGWDNSQTWGREVKVPKNFDFSSVIPTGSKDRAQWLDWWAKSERSLAAWQTLGVRTTEGKALPTRDLKAALVMPDDEKGRVYLAYSNYQTLMHWNRSYYFVTSVGYLADLIVAED
ncbi:MAG: lytic murein transglycosylase [Gammaproteobacteria bacterium]|nr:lytic murein transglycosylase [Gammaproteobacteria bacterium]MBU2057375.1 lytic murein transglycosylase [Gammaproteobacteria bacterium]MBU2176057.1 lytic murein transglycosylase [Gammaproteobacteria bacterium]MBU2245247.1 lytic murein transglycosylase [Gammaproteobacteria bacterium]MBU2344343.1 lytic murein transglycosylase [Gammaproteobacteria bacterium]